MPEFSNTAFIDWPDAFENGAYIPGAAEMPAQWARDSQALRDQLSAAGRLDADIAYGSDVRQCLDIARPEGQSQGLVVIVHGGYWHKFDKSLWTFLARGCLARGWSVALPSYRLAPSVAMAEITQDIVDAVTFASQRVEGPIRLTGHSAGGHLVTRMLNEDVPLASSILQRMVQVVPISGIYDLRPLLAHPMNEALRLDMDQATAESPALHAPRTGTPLTLWVGAEERPEFLRQTRLLCERWSAQLPDTRGIYEPGKNHFSVIDALAETDSPLTECLLQSV
ncbi:alpha/beta hydrolase [Granulosicoccus sp. 3-233]|uniref:alpha/beta hydrolase n=1 Tax=Granulosicoccus sp. 3-233 TaxID=3417969 RepID=UPI003D32AACE